MFKQLFGSGKRSSLVEAAFEDVSRMLQQSAKMLDLSLAALLENKSLDADLENMDDVVDEGERMVRRTILEHLSVNPAQDLVASQLRHRQIEDHEANLVPARREQVESLLAVRSRGDMMALERKCLRQHLPHIQFIVYD